MKAKLDAEETADRLPATEIRSLWKCARQFLQRLGTSACLGTSMKKTRNSLPHSRRAGTSAPTPYARKEGSVGWSDVPFSSSGLRLRHDPTDGPRRGSVVDKWK